MTIRELIKDKDYEYISVRMPVPKKWGWCYTKDIFIGACESVGGELISLDGDSYDPDEEVLEWEEWTNDEYEIRSGLTVVINVEEEYVVSKRKRI